MSNQNIYDTANQLERDLRALPAFTKVKESFEAIAADEATNALFNEFKAKVQEVQMKQMTGAELSQEEQADLEALQARVMENATITGLMQAEQQVQQVLTDINAIITKPLQELYSGR